MNAPVPTGGVVVDFCGETHVAQPGKPVTVGREGDLRIDDNLYLHRRFLQVEHANGMWWLANVGSRLSATVSDPDGLMQAWIAPGARLPLVFSSTRVLFTAGPTTYELELRLEDAVFEPAAQQLADSGATTVGRVALTRDQKLLVLVLAEPVLRRGERGAGQVPTNTAAARSLGWTQTKFNRKLDNVCGRLVRHGVRGLHGEPGALAANRRARLVEYAVATRLVTVADLGLLDAHRRAREGRADDGSAGGGVLPIPH
jgi:hypothetical protein